MRDAGWEPHQLLPARPTTERQRNVPKEKESEPTAVKINPQIISQRNTVIFVVVVVVVVAVEITTV